MYMVIQRILFADVKGWKPQERTGELNCLMFIQWNTMQPAAQKNAETVSIWEGFLRSAQHAL